MGRCKRLGRMLRRGEGGAPTGGASETFSKSQDQNQDLKVDQHECLQKGDQTLQRRVPSARTGILSIEAGISMQAVLDDWRLLLAFS